MTMRVTRRSVLGAAVTGGAAVGASSRLSAAQASGAGPYGSAKDSETTLSFDETWLAAYQPVFKTAHLSVKPTTLYGLRAQHPDRLTDVGVYWAYYTRQDGVTSADSHYLDREPFYVFVNPDTGEIERVRYTAYHWLAAESSQPPTVESDGGVHPTARIVQRYHHYVLASGLFAGKSDRLPLASLLEVHSPHLENGSTAWLDTGWREALRVGSVLDPWTMLSAPDWWRRDVGGISFEAERRRYEIWLASLVPGLVEGASASQTDLIGGSNG